MKSKKNGVAPTKAKQEEAVCWWKIEYRWPGVGRLASYLIYDTESHAGQKAVDDFHDKLQFSVTNVTDRINRQFRREAIPRESAKYLKFTS